MLHKSERSKHGRRESVENTTTQTSCFIVNAVEDGPKNIFHKSVEEVYEGLVRGQVKRFVGRYV